jgi:uncharacterized membrane-anchored protein YhcB (DUF1043 family)
MKKQLKLRFFLGLLLSVVLQVTAFPQAGLTTGDKILEQQKNAAGNGFDYGNKSGSALQQLENMTGRQISTPDINGQQISRSASCVGKTNTVSSNAAFQNSMKMQLASGIAGAFFSLIFSDNSQSNQQTLEAQREKAALLAQRAAIEKHYSDSVSQVKYEKMMQSYKLLNDPNAIQFKTLSTTSIQFKTLDDPGAPMTMEDKERQNIKKHGINITWDYASWTGISPNSNRIEETPVTQEEGEADKYLEAAINKIETFEGGRVAALAGRFMVNIKKGTMSYIKDASDAAITGDITKMEETGQFDLRKLTSNAIYKTVSETGTSYFEQGKDIISDKLQDANFALMESGGKAVLQNYNIFSHVSDDWKVPLRSY